MTSNLLRQSGGGRPDTDFESFALAGGPDVPEEDVEGLPELQDRVSRLADAQHHPSPSTIAPAFALAHRRLEYDGVPAGNWQISAAFGITNTSNANVIPTIRLNFMGVGSAIANADIVLPANPTGTYIYHFHASIAVATAGDFFIDIQIIDSSHTADFTASGTTNLTLTPIVEERTDAQVQAIVRAYGAFTEVFNFTNSQNLSLGADNNGVLRRYTGLGDATLGISTVASTLARYRQFVANSSLGTGTLTINGLSNTMLDTLEKGEWGFYRVATAGGTLEFIKMGIAGSGSGGGTAIDGFERVNLFDNASGQSISNSGNSNVNLTDNPRQFHALLITMRDPAGTNMFEQLYWTREIEETNAYVAFPWQNTTSGVADRNLSLRYDSTVTNRLLARRGNSYGPTRMTRVDGVKWNAPSSQIVKGVIHFPAPGVMNQDPWFFDPNLTMSDLGGMGITRPSAGVLEFPSGYKYELDLNIPRIPDSAASSLLGFRRTPVGGSERDVHPWEEVIVETQLLAGRTNRIFAIMDLTGSSAVNEQVRIRFDHQDTGDALNDEGLHMLVTRTA